MEPSALNLKKGAGGRIELDSPQKRRRAPHPLFAIIWLSLTAVLYVIDLDDFHIVTVWPIWVVAFPGVLMAAFSRSRRPLLLLAGFALTFLRAEEGRTIPRMLMPAPTGSLKVVSLNCSGGDENPAARAAASGAELILLQESPNRHEVERVAKSAFDQNWSALTGPDASILAKGTLDPLALPRTTSNFVAAVWRRTDGSSLNVVSLRLSPPIVRVDLYNPEAWRDYARQRKAKRTELEEILRILDSKGFVPDIIGGDFNTPASTGGGRVLERGWKDSFAEAGRGYGATCVNPFPLLVRIDQIWHGAKLSAVDAKVLDCPESDHRMLVADFR